MLVDAISASGGAEGMLGQRAHGGVTPPMGAIGAELEGDIGLRAGLSLGSTHQRVAGILIASGIGLWLLKYAGFRFNLGVG